jgi:hypothetical protein
MGGSAGGRRMPRARRLWPAVVIPTVAALVSCQDQPREQMVAPTTTSTAELAQGAGSSSSTVPAPGSTTATTSLFITGPARFVFGPVTFVVPPGWYAATGDRGRPDPDLAYIGEPAGLFPGSANLRIAKEYDGSVDAVRPNECPGDATAVPAPPAGVELLDSGFAPVGNRTAEYRHWRVRCPALVDTPVIEYRAWLLPRSRVAILSRRHNPTVADIIATVVFA